MRSFHISTQSRIFIIFGLLALIGTINAIWTINNAATFQRQVANLGTSAQALERSGLARSALAKEQSALKNALLSDQASDWGQVYTYGGQFIDFLNSERLYALTSEQAQLLDEISGLRSQYDQEIDSMADATWEENYDPQANLEYDRTVADPIAAQLDERMQRLSASYQVELTQQARWITATFNATASRGRWTIIILAILLVLGTYVAGQVIHPLHSLTSAIVAFQNKTYRPEMLAPYSRSRDDLGGLARALDSMATSITESNRMKDAYLQSAARFIPEQYLEFLEKPAITDVHLGDHVAAEMAVMFSDIRGFTTASERMTPQENFDFVNAYLKLVSPVVQKHEGFIVKFLGDGMMAVFPYGVDDAVQAGIEKQEKVKEFNGLLARGGYPPVTVGIGIHTGQMMVGMIGEERRMQGDAFSDHVNLTSRVEGLNKFYGTSMIISEDTRRSLEHPEAYKMRYLGKALVKGRLTPLGLYEVYQGLQDEEVARRDASQGDFERGIELFGRGRFAEAYRAFEGALRINPEDRTARFYLERCLEWAEQAPPPGWEGVIVMSEK